MNNKTVEKENQQESHKDKGEITMIQDIKDDKQNDTQTDKKPDYEPSQAEKDLMAAEQYIKDNFTLSIGTDDQLYYAEKGDYIVSTGQTDLENMIRCFSLGGYRTTSKKTAEEAYFITYNQEMRNITLNKKRKQTHTPRVVHHDNGCVYIDSANGTNDSLDGHGVIELNPHTGKYSDFAELPDGISFRRGVFSGAIFMEEDIPTSAITDLFNYINVPPKARGAVLGALVHSIINPELPQPVIHIQGERGTGKTTIARKMKELIDPGSEPGVPEITSQLSRDMKDNLVKYNASHVVINDNESSFSTDLQNFMSRAATGSGDIRRSLFTNGDATISRFTKLQIITSVDAITFKKDLQDRLVGVYPEVLNSAQGGAGYISEARMNKRWLHDLPRLRGAFYQLCVDTMKKLLEDEQSGNDATSQRLRLVDYAMTLDCMDQVLRENGIIDDNYNSVNYILESKQTLAEQSVPSVVEFMIENDSIQKLEGRPGDLLAELRSEADNKNFPKDSWGKTGRWMSIIINDHRDVLERYFTIEKTGESSRHWKWLLTRKDSILTDLVDL